MEAAVVRAFGTLPSLQTVPIPVPGPNEVLVEIVASNVRHTDLHAMPGDRPAHPPLHSIPGRTRVGYVVALGPGVRGLHEGERVGLARSRAVSELPVPRRTAPRTTRATRCAPQRLTGHRAGGTHAEFAVSDTRCVAWLPDGLAFDTALALCDDAVTAYRVLREAGVRPGQWVAVVGVGGFGRLAVQYARALGLRVVVLDVSAQRLGCAHSLGAEWCVDIGTDAAAGTLAAAAVQHELGGVHVALVAEAPRGYAQATELLRRGGTCVLVAPSPAPCRWAPSTW